MLCVWHDTGLCCQCAGRAAQLYSCAAPLQDLYRDEPVVLWCGLVWLRGSYALLDIPTSVAFVLLHALVIIAPWEVANMWKDFRAYKRGDNEHLIVAMHLGYAILDTPVVLGGVLASIMAPWRAWDLVAAVYAAKKRSTG